MSAPASGMRSTLWLCYAAMMCLALSTNLPPVFLTTFDETFGGVQGLSEEALGRIPGMLFLTMIFGILLAGPLADRFGLKRFTLLGLAFVATGIGITAIAQTFLQLLAAMTFLGLGVGTLEVVLSPIVAHLVPHERASALNKLHFFYCAGAVLAVALGSLCHYYALPWRMVLGVILFFPVAVLLAFAGSPIPSPHKDERGGEAPPPRHTGPTIYLSAFFILSLFTIALSGATEVGMAQWLPTYAERDLDMSKVGGSMALGIFSILMGLGRVITARILKHLAPETVMMISCALAALAYLLGATLPWPHAALIACVSIGLFSECLWPTTLALVANRFPNGGSTMYGLLAAAGNVGCMLMPWLIGFIATQVDLSLGLAINALSPLLLIGVLFWLRSHRQPHAHHEL